MKKLIFSAVIAALFVGTNVAKADSLKIDVSGNERVATFTHTGSFADYINFSVDHASTVFGAADILKLSLQMGNVEIKVFDITKFMAEVWQGSYYEPEDAAAKSFEGLSAKSTAQPIGKFLGGNVTNSFSLAPGFYHVQVSGEATGMNGGMYSLALNAVPVPEPESYAMLLAGLGLMGTIARRRLKGKSV